MNHTKARTTIRILLVVDYVLVRAGLQMLIEADGAFEVVGESNNGQQAVILAQTQQPDIILLDIDLGCENGLDCLGDLLEVTNGQSRVIVMIGHQELEYHSRAVCLGALGVVLKDRTPDVLLTAICKVSQGEVWLERHTVAIALADMWKSQQLAPVDPEAAKIALLTQREQEVIDLVAQGLKNKQIGDALCISEPTVRRTLGSIFIKLDLTDRLALSVYAYQNGIVTSPAGP